ncbi:telomere-protecting terminal protein Tpg [Streptomyces griseofuscus]|uniref:telomere-protecting terminal protein Tpg n=1 Tax=Streptomyces griseofuscus TaxID=146922 RepID=UPI0036FACB40
MDSRRSAPGDLPAHRGPVRGRPAQAAPPRAARPHRARGQEALAAPGTRQGAQKGLVVSTRARVGFTAAPGTTDDARIRDIIQALPPEFAGQLFTARAQGATEHQLQQIAADGLARMYFRADNTRARGPGVEVTDIEQIEIQLWSPGTR